jgi:hypothetical protein
MKIIALAAVPALLAVICLLFASVSEGFYLGTTDLKLSQRRSLEMKGKGSRVPINQRGEFVKRQKIMEQREMMRPETKKDGNPIFQVFVRPKAGGLWLPVGDLQGDQRSAAVVTAWMSGFMGDM